MGRALAPRTSRRGQITQAPNENQARRWATDPEAQYWGFPAGYVEVVSRTVVTYTSSWEPVSRKSTAPDCVAQQHDSRTVKRNGEAFHCCP